MLNSYDLGVCNEGTDRTHQKQNNKERKEPGLRNLGQWSSTDSKEIVFLSKGFITLINYSCGNQTGLSMLT